MFISPFAFSVASPHVPSRLAAVAACMASGPAHFQTMTRRAGRALGFLPADTAGMFVGLQAELFAAWPFETDEGESTGRAESLDQIHRARSDDGLRGLGPVAGARSCGSSDLPCAA